MCTSQHETETHSCPNEPSCLLFGVLCGFIIITLLMHNASMKEINTISLHSRECHTLPCSPSFWLFAFFYLLFVPLSFCLFSLSNLHSFLVLIPLSSLASLQSLLHTRSAHWCLSCHYFIKECAGLEQDRVTNRPDLETNNKSLQTCV